MTRKARKNYLLAVSNRVNRKKMYKAKKQWVVAGMSFLVATGISAIGNTLTTHASANNNVRTNRVVHQNQNHNHKKHVTKLNKKQRIQARNKRIRSRKASINNRAKKIHKAIINHQVHNRKQNKAHTNNGRQTRKHIIKRNNHKPITLHSNKKAIRKGQNKAVRANYKKVTLPAYVLNSNNSHQRNIKNDLKKHKLIKGKITEVLKTPRKAKTEKVLFKTGKSKTSSKLSNQKLVGQIPKTSNPVGEMAIVNPVQVEDTNINGTYDGLNYTFDTNTGTLEFTSGTLNWNGNDNFRHTFIGENNVPSGINLNSITSIKFDNAVNINNLTNTSFMFGNIQNLRYVSGKLNTNKITDMSRMFSSDARLSNISALENWNTSNVTDMKGMFQGDKQLDNIAPLNKWNTSKVTNMSIMFASDNLNDISTLSDWNTDNVTNMSNMFARNYSLTNVSSLKNWNTSNVTDMSNMFSDTNIANVNPLSNWDTEHVNNMSGMFSDDGALTNIQPLDNWNISSISSTGMNDIFAHDLPLTSRNNLIPGWSIDSQGDVIGFGTNSLPNTTTPIQKATIYYTNGNNIVATGIRKGTGVSGAVKVGNYPENIPSGYKAQNPNATVTYGNSIYVPIVPAHAPKTVSEHVNFNGDSSADTIVTGNNGSTKTITAPTGYHFTDGNSSETITLNGGTNTFNVARDTAADHINFNGDASADTTISGDSGGTRTITAPSGYHFTDGKSSESVRLDGGTHNFDVAKNTATDTIHYDLSGSNVPSGYQGNTGSLKTKSFTGNNSNNLSSNDIKSNVPTNYHVVSGDNGLTYDGGSHNVEIAPNSESVNVTYTNQNGRKFQDTVDGYYDTKLDITNSASIPAGYSLNPSNQDKSYTFNANNNQSKNLNIKGNQVSGKVTIHIKKYNNGSYIGSDTKQVTETGLVGNSYNINPNDYTPAGYGTANGTNTYTKEFQADHNDNNITFNYDASNGQGIPVKYVDQNNDVVNSNGSINSSKNATTGMINGKTDSTGSISSKVSVPAGFTVNSNQPSNYHITANKQAPITIHVTGKDSSNINGGNSLTVHAVKMSHGVKVGTTNKTIQLNGKVGDTKTISANDYKPANYTTASNNANVSINNNGLSTHDVTFTYDADAGTSIHVEYKNKKTGSDVKDGTINGTVDQNINALNAVPSPSGYTVDNGQNTTYTVSTSPQSKVIYVTGKTASQVNNSNGYTPKTPNSPNDPQRNTDLSNNGNHGYFTYEIIKNNKVNGKQSDSYQTVNLNSSSVGDGFHVTAPNFKGYTLDSSASSNDPFAGKVQSNGGVNPYFAKFVYNKNIVPAKPITVNYVNQTGATIGTKALNGNVGATANLDSNVPNGYTVNSGQSNSKTFSNSPQTATVHVTGKSITGTVKVHLNYKNGKHTDTRVVNLPINAHVGDKTLAIKPNTFSKNGYHTNDKDFDISFNTKTPSHLNLDTTFTYGKNKPVSNSLDPNNPNSPLNPNNINSPLDPNNPNSPFNVNNPNSPLNPNNPSSPLNPNNPNSILNPNNPNSPLNPNNNNNPDNPNNPNSLLNPKNPNSPLNPDNPRSPLYRKNINNGSYSIQHGNNSQKKTSTAKPASDIDDVNILHDGQSISYNGKTITRVAMKGHFRYARIIAPTWLHTNVLLYDNSHVGTLHNASARPAIKIRKMFIVQYRKGGGHYLRYEVSYGGINYFITANPHFAPNAYVQKHNVADKLDDEDLYVETTHHVYEYKSKNYSHRNYIRCFKPGTTLHVARVVHIGKVGYGQTRFQLTNGRYITANRNYIEVL